jgi:hypothetical protein
VADTQNCFSNEDVLSHHEVTCINISDVVYFHEFNDDSIFYAEQFNTSKFDLCYTETYAGKFLRHENVGKITDEKFPVINCSCLTKKRIGKTSMYKYCFSIFAILLI